MSEQHPKRDPKLRKKQLIHKMGAGIAAVTVIGCFGVLALTQWSLTQELTEVNDNAVSFDIINVKRQSLPQTVELNGKLEAFQVAKLAFGAPGRIAEIHVQPGDTVREGQALAYIDPRDLELEVQLAKASLTQAQANYDRLLSGATPEEIADRDATIAQARSSLDQVRQTIPSRNVEQVQSLLETERQYRQARSAHEQLQAQASEQRSQASLNKTNAERILQQQTDALREAQTAYSDAFWQLNYVENTGYDPITQNPPLEDSPKLNDFQRQQYQDAFTQTEINLRNAERAVEEAQIAFEQAQRDEITQVAQIESQIQLSSDELEDAEASFLELSDPQTAYEVAPNRTSSIQAHQEYEQAEQQAIQSNIVAAQESLQAAEQNKAALLRGATQPDLMEAEAQIEQAQAQLAQADIAMSNTTLRAPWSGVVLDVMVESGEFVSEDTITIQLADRTGLILQGQVDELDIIHIEEGQKGDVRIDALPDILLEGSVISVAQAATQTMSDEQPAMDSPSTYTVFIKVNDPDAAIRIGMAATSHIQIRDKTDVLVIPRQALHEYEDGTYYVERLVDVFVNDDMNTPQTEQISVDVGMQTPEFVEIRTGLQEDDQILLPTLPSTTSDMLP